MIKLHPHPIDVRPGQRSRFYVNVGYRERNPRAVQTIIDFMFRENPLFKKVPRSSVGRALDR